MPNDFTDYNFYTDGDIAEIVKAGTPKDTMSPDEKRICILKKWLEESGADFFHAHYSQKNDSPSKRVTTAGEVAKAAKQLRRSLTKEAKALLYGIACRSNNQNPQTEITKIDEAINAIKWIEELAKEAKQKDGARKKQKTDMNRNSGNPARTQFIYSLEGIWKKIWKKKPTVSRSETGSTSPFIQFVIACYKPLCNNYPDVNAPTEGAIKRIIERKSIQSIS
jgi:hypothetical protein